MRIYPPSLKKEAKDEVYQLIDKKYKKLPKDNNGKINELAEGFEDNDVDALRHAYVSGVFTQEYGEYLADLFGRLNEKFPGGGVSSSNSELSMNMDLWNNSVGRKYGKKTKSREKLFTLLLQALKRGEFIIDLSDPRKYKGAGVIKENVSGLVIVLEESKTGENLTFYDLSKKTTMNKGEFVASIKNGEYPQYEIRNIDDQETPASIRDGIVFNNLG